MKYILKKITSACQLTLAFSVLSTSAWAISQAQIAQFQSLPESQQQALAAQYGVDLAALKAGQTSGSGEAQQIVETDSIKPRRVETSVNEMAIEQNASEASDKVTVTETKEEKVVEQKLKQFGYDLFAGVPTTFAPVSDIPVSMDYIVGPGDHVVVQLYGKENALHNLTINREGVLQFPGIGPVTVNGMSFAEMKEFLLQTIERQTIGVKASITMGELRSIRVFVLGDAYQPGSYTVSSLSTITNALFVSGGVSKIGSLRNIELKRRGQLIATLDLYDLLLRGDTSQDKRLLPGDVIFVPPIGTTVGIAGEVKRPAIYELKNEKNTDALIELAGGFLPTAYPQASRVERISDNGSRTILDIDLTGVSGRQANVQNGDIVQVFSVLDKMENIVLLEGHVTRPGGFAWTKGMRISDVVGSYRELLPNPDANFGLIVRESRPDRRISVLSFKPQSVLRNPGSVDDLLLNERDRVLFFGAEQDRDAMVKPIISRLKSQATFVEPANTAQVSGNVRFSGEYPFMPGSVLADLVDAASGLKPDTDTDYAILVRESLNTGKVSVKHIPLKGGEALYEALQPKDHLYVFGIYQSRVEALETINQKLQRQVSNGETSKLVTVVGSVRFEGTYPLTNSMSVAQLLSAAGGFTENAYSLYAEITRTQISADNLQQNERITLNLADPQAYQTKLAPRDRLYIKSIPDWNIQERVTLSGEVKLPGDYPIYKGDTLADLIERAGGLTEHAYIPGAVFTRKALRKQEALRIKEMRERLASELVKTELSLSQTDNQKKSDVAEVGKAEELLQKLDDAKALGRLVISLEKVLKRDSRYSITLEDGDSLSIPPLRNSVTIIGEVQYPTSQMFEVGLSFTDYIERSGGLTDKADDSRIYIVKADGSVRMPQTKKWFIGMNEEVGPGDSVVVPLDTDKMNQLQLWTNVSQIFYQIALGAAAVGSL